MTRALRWTEPLHVKQRWGTVPRVHYHSRLTWHCFSKDWLPAPLPFEVNQQFSISREHGFISKSRGWLGWGKGEKWNQVVDVPTTVNFTSLCLIREGRFSDFTTKFKQHFNLRIVKSQTIAKYQAGLILRLDFLTGRKTSTWIKSAALRWGQRCKQRIDIIRRLHTDGPHARNIQFLSKKTSKFPKENRS